MSCVENCSKKLLEKDKEIEHLKNIINKLKMELQKERNKNNKKISPYLNTSDEWGVHIDILKSTNFV